MSYQHPEMIEIIFMDYQQSLIKEAEKARLLHTSKAASRNPIVRRNKQSLIAILISLVVLLIIVAIGAKATKVKANGINNVESAESNLSAAVSAIKEQDYASAISYLDAALNIDGTDPNAYLLETYVTLQQDQPDLALFNIQIVSHIHPDFTATYFFSAEAECELGNYEDAQRDYDTYFTRVHEEGNEPFIIHSLLEIDTYALAAERPIECTRTPLG